MRIDIYGDGISYVTDEVSKILPKDANLNEYNRRKFVTDLAAISRGKLESNNYSSRYNSLCLEAAPQDREINIYNNTPPIFRNNKIPGSPSRPLEFLPILLIVEQIEDKIKVCSKLFDLDEFSNSFGGSLGYLSREGTIEQRAPFYYLYTNMRAMINSGIPYNDIPFNEPEDMVNFVAIRANIPMFVWAQVPNTHIMISKESQSDRVTTNKNYWLPKDFRNRVFNYREENKKNNGNSVKVIFSKITDEILGCSDYSQVPQLLLNGRHSTRFFPTKIDVMEFFKEVGYNKEIYQRAMHQFKYKEVVMTGWKNNPKVWNHLFNERNANLDVCKNWTQRETKQFVVSIKKIIDR